MICYHHDDLDGNMAAGVVHMYKPKGIVDFPSSYIEMDYNSKFDKHTHNDDVIIVDLSISESSYEDFVNVCKTARSVTYIDHHKTTVETFAKHKEELQAIDNLTYFVSEAACGALLAYAYFSILANHGQEIVDIRDIDKETETYSISADYKYDKNGIGKMDVELLKENTKQPIKSKSYRINLLITKPALLLTDDFDRWVYAIGDKDAERFSLGFLDDYKFTIRTLKDEPIYNDQIILAIRANNFYSEDINQILKTGGNVKTYLTNRYSNEISSTFEWTCDGTKFLCKNATGNSWNFGNLVNKYDAVILFNYDGKSATWVYSVYASERSNFNCKDFAEKFGGGGHLKASGFSTKYLIFTDKKAIEDTKKDLIFLGGTVNGDDWRKDFVNYWRKLNKDSETEFYDPVVKDREWTSEDQDKEDEIKDSARLNIFIITPDMQGCYSIAEAIECCHYGKVFFAIYDKNHIWDRDVIASFNTIGCIIQKNKGFYKDYTGPNCMEDLVKDVIDFI